MLVFMQARVAVLGHILGVARAHVSNLADNNQINLITRQTVFYYVGFARKT